MKIIQDNFNNIKTYTVMCNKCSSLLEITKNDLLEVNDKTVADYYFICPLCENKNYMAPKFTTWY